MATTRKSPASRVMKPKQGKKSSGSTTPRLLFMNQVLHGTKRTWTVKQLQTYLAESDPEFEVDPNTVRRNLITLERLGWVTRAEGRPPTYQGRGKSVHLHQTSTEPQALMHKNSPMRWIPIEIFSRDMGETVEDTLDVIRQGHLDGIWLGGHWYVLDLAVIDTPDPKRPTRGQLRVAANCNGNLLTAGSGVLTIDLVYDPELNEQTALMLLPDNPPQQISVPLGSRTYLVDRSLQRSIAAALIEWEIQVTDPVKSGN